MESRETIKGFYERNAQNMVCNVSKLREWDISMFFHVKTVRRLRLTAGEIITKFFNYRKRKAPLCR
jgi:hypothetical protein